MSFVIKSRYKKYGQRKLITKLDNWNDGIQVFNFKKNSFQ